MPGYHALLGMHAFGLEECADYARAEAQGRTAVELEPRDGWAQHAVAHVMEMQCRQADGIAWMRAAPDAWSTDSFFKVHLWWHLALYHLELGEIDEVLALFDGPIYGERSPVVLNMIDASAMLWRLHLRGIDVGQRWEAVADGWRPFARAGNYVFNDVHAVMAFIGARRADAVEEVLDAQQAVMRGAGDNASFTREVGHPLTLALKAFGEERYNETVRLIRPLREIAHRFGGSHAQRDLLDLALIGCAAGWAAQSGRGAVCRAPCLAYVQPADAATLGPRGTVARCGLKEFKRSCLCGSLRFLLPTRGLKKGVVELDQCVDGKPITRYCYQGPTLRRPSLPVMDTNLVKAVTQSTYFFQAMVWIVTSDA